MELSYGARLRREVGREPLPFIGVYDAFSATVAARHFTGLFISGFGFAASYYGLPDIGFIAWSDMAAYVGRLRTVLPQCHLLVDIDDGYCDSEVACHVAALMEAQGASGVVLEDQLRPRKCGHYSGKQLMGLPEYLAKLERMLAARRELFVVARTDAGEPEEMLRRAAAFADAGADAVLVDAIPDLDMLRALKARVNRPIVCNQLAGGKSPAWSLTELGEAGVSLVIYSTPCLFAAQEAIEDTLVTLKEQGGRLLQGITSRVALHECTEVLNENLRWRHGNVGKQDDDELLADAA
ncbi:MAG: isocitrate lyase/PEP mutase family protein [Armatimonadota bacterium]